MDDNDHPASPGKQRRGIQSVEIGFRVLQALVRLRGPSPLSAVAKAAHLSSPQTHRYLASLIATEMAVQDPHSGRYDLGPGALMLGLSALSRIDAFEIADTALKAYVRQTGRTVQVAALGPLGPTIVRWHEGRPPVMTSFNVGSVLPLMTSATGHVFLAYAAPAELEPILEREVAHVQADEAAIEAIRIRVRAAGRADVRGTMIPGLLATAVPIFDLQGRVVLTATALASEAFVATDEGEDPLAALQHTCSEISARLGAPVTAFLSG